MSSNAAHEARQQQMRTRLQSRLAAQREAQAGQLQHIPPSSPRLQPPLSPAQICPVDWLAHAFSFLPLKVQPLLMRVCRSWGAAAARVPSLHTEVGIAASRWQELSASPLRRHVAKLTSKLQGYSCADVAWLHRLPALTELRCRINDPALSQAEVDPAVMFEYPPTLMHLAVAQHGCYNSVIPQWSMPGQQLVLSAIGRLPRLESLGLVVNLQVIPVADAAAILPFHPFPHSLQKLQVFDTGRGRHAVPSRARASRQQLLDGIGELSRLEQLSLSISIDDIDLTPLLRATSLSSLEVHDRLHAPPSHLLSLVRRLASLVDLELGCRWEPDMLAELCAAPHCRLDKLQRLAVEHSYITLPHMQQLIKLPSLTELRPQFISPDAFPLLADLPNVRTLYLWLSPGQALEAHRIGSCPQLTELILDGVQLYATHLHMLGERMPQLQHLQLLKSPLPDGFASLSCLARLQTLIIVPAWASSCPSLSTLRLPSLTALRLWVPADDRAARMEQLRQARDAGQLPTLDLEHVVFI